MQLMFIDPVSPTLQPHIGVGKLDEPKEGTVKTVTHCNGEVVRYKYAAGEWYRVPITFGQSVRNSLVAVAARFDKGAFYSVFWWNQTKKDLKKALLALFGRHRYRLRHGTPTARDLRRFEKRVERGLAYVFRNYEKGE